MTKRNALQSLHVGGTYREQTVGTPQKILDPLVNVWDRIEFDPCAAPEGPIEVRCPCKKFGGEPVQHAQTVVSTHTSRLPQDGLALTWIDRTFCNPPYKLLKPWLAPSIAPGARVAWLVPVRPHRKWWRAWARDADVVVYLDPFKFLGHCQTFPAPMCIGYRGYDASTIVKAYEHLGSTIESA